MAMYNNTRLGPTETALIATWARTGKRSVTARDLRQELGASSANGVIKGLVSKGLLERIGGGTYIIHPIRALARRQATSGVVAVKALMGERPFYIGGRWAWTHHGFTQQVYAYVIDVFTVAPRGKRNAGQATLKFHARPAAAFTHGVQRITIEDIEIPISDSARTVIDVLDTPTMFGSSDAAQREVISALPKVDHDQLIRHAMAAARITTCQRLGVLLERSGTTAASIDDLQRRIQGPRSLTAMLRGRPRRGPINQRWRVIENDVSAGSS